MKAVAHTHSMIRWWEETGINRVDFAARRASGAMLWHYAIPLKTLPLSWARAENMHKSDIYIRPAREYAWPLVYLDDVPVTVAGRVARKYDALVVKTSEVGGCHLWLTCSFDLDEDDRRQAQRWLIRRIEADPASASGEHLGRLAGFKNWKRGGTWVNVLAASRRGRPWLPIVEADVGDQQLRRRPKPISSPIRNTDTIRNVPDTSESGKEWGWVCRMLEAGYDPSGVYYRLVQRARPRRGNDAERYARLTVIRALAHVRNTA